MQVVHLTRRFFSSLGATEPTGDEEAWLVALLSPAEEALYRAQPAVDRRHSINCALATREFLGPRASHHIVVASALHDVGKADADLGTLGRVAATVIGVLAPARVMVQWAADAGWRGRVGRYLRHDVRGSELLMVAGSHPAVVAWAREHHEPRGAWSIDTEIGEALVRSDA